jgi:TonB family protein
MKTLRVVLVISCATCALGIVQVHADATDSSANTPPTPTDRDSGGWEIPKLPHAFQPENDREWFPPKARRMGMEGRVLVAFDITARGRAEHISVIWSESEIFESSAVNMLESTRFNVPSDWSENGAWKRWRMGFVYRLSPGCQSDQFAIPVAETVTITGSRLSGAPVRRCTPSSR